MKGLFKFPNREKLKHAKKIEQIFAEGISFHVFPVRIVYTHKKDERAPGLQAGFSVSKKKFKSAVDRNRIKRLMREGFRLQVPALRLKLKEMDLDLYAMFIFTGVEIPDQKTVLKSFHKIMNRLLNELEERRNQ